MRSLKKCGERLRLKAGRDLALHTQELPGGFPGDSDGKESACNVGDPGLIPWLERSPGEGNGYPLQYSYLGNHRGRGTWWATVHGVSVWCNTHTPKNSIAVPGIIYSDIYYTFPPEGGACQSLLAGCKGGLKYVLPLKNVPLTKRSHVYRSIAGVAADITLKHIHNSHIKAPGAYVGGLAGEIQVSQHHKRESS